MKLLLTLLAGALVVTCVRPQGNSENAMDVENEPHHVLILQNPSVRVFQVKLRPNESTLPHRHSTFYAFLSLNTVTLSNEVPGRAPVLTQADAGELHTSKGGFTVAERNQSGEVADLLVIEAIKRAGSGFSGQMGSFRFRDAAFAPLFESSAVRGYSMTIAATRQD